MSSKKTPSLRDLSRCYPSSEQRRALFEEIARGSDRSSAILSTNALDAVLGQVIIDYLQKRDDNDAIDPLFERDGSLSTFFGKVHLAYAMGLFDRDTRDNLNCIRRVRNAFAHAAVPVKFAQEEISKEVRKMSTWDFATKNFKTLTEYHNPSDSTEVSIERVCFTATCNIIIASIALKGITRRDEMISALNAEISRMSGTKAK